MAWVSSGSGTYVTNYSYPDGLPVDYTNYKQRLYTWSLSCGSDSCLYIKKQKPDENNNISYDIYCVKRGTGKRSEGKRNGTLTEEYYEHDTNITTYNNQPFNNFTLYRVGSYTDTLGGKRVVANYSGGSTIPTFDDNNAINAYIKNGDTSGALIDVATKWNLFIDGNQNPLYKLTWNCEGINDLDVSNSFIKLWIGKYDAFLGTVIDIIPFKKIAYSEGKCKFSFADISKLIDQPTIGHNPACLLMQLGYRKFVTARIDASTKMGVNLYFDKSSIQTMYDNLGYFTVEEGVTKKTNTGDGSKLTVKVGKEGSDGYTSDDDGGYDDGKDDDDSDGESKDISAGIGVLTTTFKMTKERLQQLGQFLWGSSIFDKFSLVNNNPIENIVSCKAIPLEQSGVNQQIVLGNVNTGVNGEKISTNFGKTTIGSVTVAEYYKNFLDYSPYTNVIIYLPYIGFRELDTSMVMGKTLKVEYTTDCITGGCLAQISVDGVRLYEFTGNMGIDIPITASNRAQVESGYIQAGVGAAMSLAGGNIAGATTALINSATAQYHYSSTGNPSPMCVASTNRTCYVVIDRPQFQKLKAFNHTRGQKCNLSKTIGSLKGFTICDSNIDLSGISATETEKDEIVNILSTGFFA